MTKRHSALKLTLLIGVGIFLAGCNLPGQKDPPTLSAPLQAAPLQATQGTAASATLPPLRPPAPATAIQAAPSISTATSAAPSQAAPTQALPTASPLPRPTFTPTFDPQGWQQLPVIPAVSPIMKAAYQRGQQAGLNPHTFSKVGDCETAANWFLANFDGGPDHYNLGAYASLQPAIDQFKGSFGRSSQAAKPGFTVASVLNPYFADPAVCLANESPLACEYRLNRPSYAIIMLGTNDISFKSRSTFENKLRQIVTYSLDQGVIPILATKADNLEGDYSINIFIARLAYETGVPLWNFWTAIQPLPDHGLQADGIHLTWGLDDFSDPTALRRAWPVRNLTALQMLDAVWKSVSGGN